MYKYEGLFIIKTPTNVDKRNNIIKFLYSLDMDKFYGKSSPIRKMIPHNGKFKKLEFEKTKLTKTTIRESGQILLNLNIEFDSIEFSKLFVTVFRRLFESTGLALEFFVRAKNNKEFYRSLSGGINLKNKMVLLNTANNKYKRFTALKEIAAYLIDNGINITPQLTRKQTVGRYTIKSILKFFEDNNLPLTIIYSIPVDVKHYKIGE